MYRLFCHLLKKVSSCIAIRLKQTRFITENSLLSDPLKKVEDYKYLCSYISSEKDFEVRKGLAWNACNKLQNIWSSNLIEPNLKVKVFKSTIEPILNEDNSQTITTLLQLNFAVQAILPQFCGT